MRFAIFYLINVLIFCPNLFSMKQKGEKVAFDKNVLKQLSQEEWINIFGSQCKNYLSENYSINFKSIAKKAQEAIKNLTQNYDQITNNEMKQRYVFLSALANLDTKGAISSHAFLYSLKYDSHIPFSVVFTKIPVYDAKDDKKIYKKPYEKYMNFLIRRLECRKSELLKESEVRYDLINRLWDHPQFTTKLSVLLFKYSPFVHIFETISRFSRGHTFECYKNANDLFNTCQCDVDGYTTITVPYVIHKGKLFLLENPEAYDFVKKYDTKQVFFKKEFHQDPKKFFFDYIKNIGLSLKDFKKLN